MSQPPSFDKMPPAPPPLPPGGGGPPAYYGAPAMGPVGKVRGTGLSIFLFIITFGIYGWFWWGYVHAEMKRHSGEGIGGPLAVVIAIIIAPVAAFLTCNEVEHLYERRGQRPPVRTTTGLWYFPGNFIVVGPIIWFVQTNAALNDYWRSLGAR